MRSIKGLDQNSPGGRGGKYPARIIECTREMSAFNTSIAASVRRVSDDLVFRFMVDKPVPRRDIVTHRQRQQPVHRELELGATQSRVVLGKCVTRCARTGFVVGDPNATVGVLVDPIDLSGERDLLAD